MEVHLSEVLCKRSLTILHGDLHGYAVVGGVCMKAFLGCSYERLLYIKTLYDASREIL